MTRFQRGTCDVEPFLEHPRGKTCVNWRNATRKAAVAGSYVLASVSALFLLFVAVMLLMTSVASYITHVIVCANLGGCPHGAY